MHSTRKRTGTLERRKLADGTVRYSVRLRLADGTKSPRYDVPANYTTEAAARGWAEGQQAKEDVDGVLMARKLEHVRTEAQLAHVPHDGECADAFHVRYCQTFPERDWNRSVANMWRKWISPMIGTTSMNAVSRDQIEDVRDQIDKAVKEGRMSPKYAMDVWSVLRGTFRAAVSAKDRTLRVRADDPTYGVQPPDKGPSKRKHWIYPNEFKKLIECEEVPLEWRRLYALAMYSYARPNELAALTWEMVDLEQREIKITRAIEWASGKVKAPKTAAGHRRIAIHEELYPVLVAMKGEDGSPVSPAFNAKSRFQLARLFRAHLKLAGVARKELFDETKTDMAVNFRSLRDSGITWSAIAGVDLVKLQRRAGHEGIAMTLVYVKEAEDRPQLAGQVFPSLRCLVSSPVVQAVVQKTDSPLKPWRKFVGAVGIEARKTDTSYEVTPTCEQVSVSAPQQTAREIGAADQTLGQNGITSETACGAPKASEARSVEESLSVALSEAAKAGQWQVVSQLARELEARRLAGSNVIALVATKAK